MDKKWDPDHRGKIRERMGKSKEMQNNQVLKNICATSWHPILIRYIFVARFIELREPLDFIFHTCADELSGVCSYPQADLVLGEVNFQTPKISWKL